MTTGTAGWYCDIWYNKAQPQWVGVAACHALDVPM